MVFKFYNKATNNEKKHHRQRLRHQKKAKISDDQVSIQLPCPSIRRDRLLVVELEKDNQKTRFNG